MRDDNAWITRLSRDFWWNLERLSEMTTASVHLTPQTSTTKCFPQQLSSSLLSSMQSNVMSARKIVGQQHSITNRLNTNDIPSKMTLPFIYDQDIDYNPFQSKICLDNSIWTNNSQQTIPWQ